MSEIYQYRTFFFRNSNRGKMKGQNPFFFKILLCLFLLLGQFVALAQTNTPMRRPVSTSSPMYIMHIDTWNYADPQKIINLIPADIRPYVVMNISLSVSHDATGRFQTAEYGYEVAKSWLRVCAENRMWATVQPSSGGMTQFSDFDLSVYEEFYKNYPNFIGFNYAEQFWGYGVANNPISASWTDRMAHLANLLKISDKYGGYLIVSWCGNQFSPNINPIAMMKRNPAFAAACKQYTKNFILCEKYTTVSYQHDMESICLGTYLSGFSGNYGIRYDVTGWTDSTGVHQNFTMATASAPILEHTMLTGQTVVDGPELIWTQCFQETSAVATTDNYTTRNWTTFPQFDNVSVDLFRKVLDGSVRIPSRQEVINRTKVVIINDVNTGSDNDMYSSPQTLFDGLYRMDATGSYENNKTFFKKMGRYPTVPTVYQLSDALANSFQVKVNKSTMATRWPSIAAKVNELNSLFPQEYTGDIYAGRHENGWVVYNPYKTNQIASGCIPFKYNTADSMQLAFSQYTAGVIKETSNQLKIYLNNYDNFLNSGLKTDIIKIYGSTLQPTWSYIDRASHQASSVSASWSGGVFTLTIQHNGPLDITVNCAGTATGRLTSYTPPSLVAPERPAAYAGPRQYEAEIFDYKNVSGIVKNGYSGSIRNYTGQGYLQLGTNAAAAIRKTVTVLQPGSYLLQTRYSVTGGNVTTVDLYVNGSKVSTPTFTQTASASDWSINAQSITLAAGANTIEFRARAAGSFNMNVDNIVVSAGSADKYHFNNDIATTSATNPPAYVMTLQSGTAGVVSYTDANNVTSNVFKAYSGGAVNGTGVVDLDLFASSANYSITWKEYAGTPGGKKGILLRASGSSGSSPYALGMKQGYLFTTINNSNNTVTLQPYIASSAGISPQPAYTSSFTVDAHNPTWYRATAFGNMLKFEASIDSINWEGGNVATFTDNTYPSGTTQLLWGFGAINFSWFIDNITYHAPKLSTNKVALQGFSYVEGGGPSASQMLTISGQSLKADIPVTAPANYEISLNAASGYTNALTLARVADSVPATNMYVRLKAGLMTNTYKGNITIGDSENSIKVSLNGGVTLLQVYTFTDDAATTTAQNPPAANITVGTGNGATAGVISYTDAANNTSNYLKLYGVGSSNNGTGVLNLNLFPTNSTDYSVTWKQAVLDSTKSYKTGVLLRGSGVGGYTQGIMQGYLFNASNSTPSNTSFRIFKSTSSGIGSAISSGSANPNVRLANNKSVWYRASVSGTSPVNLKFEYSADSITWYTGTSFSDNSSPFISGATQYVLGLFSTTNDVYLDNITLNSVPSAADITLSQTVLTGYAYKEGAGPSTTQSFSVSGTKLSDNLVLTAPATFEISLNATTGFANTLTLPQSSGTLTSTTIYARQKAGLAAGDYEGNLSFKYTSEPSGFDKVVTLRGTVSKPMIAVSATSLYNLGYISSAGSSLVGSFIVSGTTLSQNVEIAAPANFEISLSAGSGYTASLSLATSSGTVAPTTIYVRMVSGQAVNTYNGTIALTSTGADSKSVALSGTVSEQAVVYTSETMITGLGYSTYSNVPPVKSFLIWGSPLAGDITITAPANFEVSRTANNGYGTDLTLGIANGKVDSTIIFVRLKDSLAENSYSGNVVVASSAATNILIGLSGSVSASRMYDFTVDAATTTATTPPASGITVATGNNTTAGVVSYTDAAQNTSNRFRAYSGGNRNGTGVVDLHLFPTNATDYSVIWKQSNGSVTDYKVGCLLRGNGPVGTATTGYVQGIMNGYVFIVYNAGSSRTEFRIYRSTAATSLNTLVNTTVSSHVPAVGQTVWYRASATGVSPVSLKLEYSTDSITWNNGAVATDASAGAFTSGATQLVWGLASPGFNFFMDDITFKALPKVQLASASNLTYDGQPHAASGFAYGTGGESDRLSPELSFTYRDAKGQVLEGAPIQAGTYSVSASFAGNSNYLPASATATITITPRPLTITAADQTMECGRALHLGTTAFTTEGLIAGDVVNQVSLSSTGGSVGTYAIVPSDAAGTGLSNYTITYVNGSLVVKDLTQPVITYTPEVPVQCYNTSGSYNIPELRATDGCSAVKVRYTISGATTRSGSSADASGSFGVGTSTINWVVEDGQGNESTALTTVVVNAPLSVNIPDVYALNPAVDEKNTIYIGYGPSSLNISAVAEGGTSPYTYQWSNGQTSQSISVSTVDTYKVTVNDANQCTASAAIVIKTVDVTCGQNSDKVMICHNGKEICIASEDVQAHLDHGDHLGRCNVVASLSPSNNFGEKTTPSQVRVYPNPAQDKIYIQIRGDVVNQHRRISIIDLSGKTLLQQEVKGQLNIVMPIDRLKPGFYLVKVMGDKTVTFKIVKH